MQNVKRTQEIGTKQLCSCQFAWQCKVWILDAHQGRA